MSRFLRRDPRPDEHSRERGEMLVELLITTAILGIAVVAIFGTIWTSLRVADYHRKTTTADVVLRNYAESMQQSTGTFQYVECATLSGAGAYPLYSTPPPHSSYLASITKIEYLTGYSASNEPTWQNSTAGCPAGGDKGLQRLSLMVDGPITDPKVRGVEKVTIIKRDARGES
ncbi:MAG: type IV pilus modification PilV family protein [Microbacterium sp.]